MLRRGLQFTEGETDVDEWTTERQSKCKKNSVNLNWLLMTNPLTAVSPQRKGTQLEEAYEFFFFKVALCWQGAPIKMASECTLSAVRKKISGWRSFSFSFFPPLHAWRGVLCVAATAAWVAGQASLWRRRAVPSAPHQPLINQGTTITRVQMLVAWSRQLWNNFIDSAVAQGDTNAHARTKGEVSDSRGRRGGVNTEDLTGIYPPPHHHPLNSTSHTHSIFRERKKKNGCKLARTCACKRTCALGSHAHFLYPVV